MAPKLAPSEKCLRTKKAGSLLASQMLADQLREQKKQLKSNLKALAASRKKAMRQARALKAKANKTDMKELMQIIVMKASLADQDHQANIAGGASSSSDAWTPQSPTEAFAKIQDVLSEEDKKTVEEFAAALRKKAATNRPDQ